MPPADQVETKKANSNLAVRVGTAVVAVPLILLLLYKVPPWGLYLLALPALLVGSWELFAMTHPGDKVSQLIGVVMAGAVSTTLFFLGTEPKYVIAILAIVPVSGPLLTLVRLGDIKTTALRSMAMGMGPLYVAIPLTLLAMIRRDVPNGDGPSYVVMTLMFAWFSDTGGYFAGRFLGKHKLYEAVSPKKTVEGAIGGLCGSAFGAVLAHFWFLPSLSLAHGIPLAIVAGALGQAGDLGESLIKRATGVKDSGAIVPGHGGILDRVDALLLTSTVTFLYTLFVLR
ncbi:phosphatidate cytidylyltransferase [soil metagenome]